MKINRGQKALFLILAVGIVLLFGSIPASATHDPFPMAPAGIPGNGYVGDDCHDFSKCGYNGPLIWNPFTVVASGLAWTKKHWETPILHGTRGASYLGQNDIYDQKCINELISGNGRVNDGVVDSIYGGPYKAPYSAWPVPEAEWLASLPRSTEMATPCSTPGSMCDPGVTTGATYPNIWLSNQGTNQPVPNPNNYGAAANAPVNNQGQGSLRCVRTSWKLLIMGNMGNGGQTNNTASRLNVVYARNLAGSLIWDFSHPDAFKNSNGDARVTEANAAAPLLGKRDSELLSEPDALANVNAWYDAGYSRGLGYDLYSLGLATFANGLLGQVGGRHYATNGLRKMNIYNPGDKYILPQASSLSPGTMGGRPVRGSPGISGNYGCRCGKRVRAAGNPCSIPLRLRSMASMHPIGMGQRLVTSMIQVIMEIQIRLILRIRPMEGIGFGILRQVSYPMEW